MASLCPASPLSFRWRILSFSFLLCFYALSPRADNILQITDITVIEGEHTELRCDHSENGMSWRYYTDLSEVIGSGIDFVAVNRRVYPAYEGRFSFYSGEVYGLVVQSANLSDNGVYKCASIRTVLSVTKLHVVPWGWPICGVSSSNDNEHDPLDVILECESGLSNNFPQIRWFREDTELENSRELARLDHETSLTSEDEDVTYTCVLGDGDTRSSPSCSIVPYPGKPTGKLTKSSGDTVVGGNVTFVCTGSAKTGNVSIVWDQCVLSTFADRFSVRSNNTQLELFNIRPSDDGTLITCTVTASTGTFNSFKTVLHVAGDSASDNYGPRSGRDAGFIIVVILLLVTVAVAVFAVAAVIGLLRLLMRREDRRRSPDEDSRDALEMKKNVITNESPMRPVGNGDAESAAGASRDELQVSHGRNSSSDVAGYLSLENASRNLPKDYEKLNSSSYEEVNPPHESLVEHGDGEDLGVYESVRGTEVSGDGNKANGMPQPISSSEDMDGYMSPMQSED